jgi:hypothetical protein
MLVSLSVGLTLLVATSGFLAVRSLLAIFRRRWRAAWGVIGGAGLLAFTFLLLAAAAYLLGPARLVGNEIDPSQRARVLAENISKLMNISIWGLPLGVLAALVAVFRDRRRTRSQRHGSEHQRPGL